MGGKKTLPTLFRKPPQAYAQTVEATLQSNIFVPARIIWIDLLLTRCALLLSLHEYADSIHIQTLKILTPRKVLELDRLGHNLLSV